MKVRTINRSRFGLPISLPDVGIVNVDNEGVVDVPEEVANLLVEKTDDWEYVLLSLEEMKQKDSADEKVKVPAKTKEKVEPKVPEPKLDDNTLKKADLDLLSVDELKEFAKSELNMTDEEIAKFKDKKPLLISAILKNQK